MTSQMLKMEHAGGTHWQTGDLGRPSSVASGRPRINSPGAANPKDRAFPKTCPAGGDDEGLTRVHVGSHEPCSRRSRQNALGRTTFTSQPSPLLGPPERQPVCLAQMGCCQTIQADGPFARRGAADGWFGAAASGFDETRLLPDAALCVIGGLVFPLGAWMDPYPQVNQLIWTG